MEKDNNNKITLGLYGRRQMNVKVLEEKVALRTESLGRYAQERQYSCQMIFDFPITQIGETESFPYTDLSWAAQWRYNAGIW